MPYSVATTWGLFIPYGGINFVGLYFWEWVLLLGNFFILCWEIGSTSSLQVENGVHFLVIRWVLGMFV